MSDEQRDRTPKLPQGGLLGAATVPLLVNLVLFVAAVAVAMVGMFAGGALGLVLVGVGALLMFAGLVVLLLGNRRVKAADPSIPPADQWWYNSRTGEVEQGPQSLGAERDGPYTSREEALRAPEIARERSARWAAEDEAKDS